MQGFIYTLLLSASAKVTNDLDMAPGGEFRNAFNEVNRIDIEIEKLSSRKIANSTELPLLGIENTRLYGNVGRSTGGHYTSTSDCHPVHLAKDQNDLQLLVFE